MKMGQIKAHFARPNWKKVFSHLASTHQSAKIGNSYETYWKPIFKSKVILVLLSDFSFDSCCCRCLLLWKSDPRQTTEAALQRVQSKFINTISFSQGELLE